MTGKKYRTRERKTKIKRNGNHQEIYRNKEREKINK
jgi:hypothetical protein